MVKTLLLGLLSAIAGVGAWIFALPHAIIILASLQFLDFITGLILAWGNKSIASVVAQAGIKKKIYAWIIVMVVGILQWELKEFMDTKILLSYTPMEVAAMGFAVAEAISIIENADRLGWWVPAWLKDSLAHADRTLDGGGEEKND